MNIGPVIKAPIAVQLNRIAFAIYAGFFASPLWRYRHVASGEGAAILLGMVFLSVLGHFYSCIRARRSRWIMAVLGLLIPGIFWTGMCLMEFSSPEGFWDWLLQGLFALFAWFSIPISLALSLFTSIHRVSFDKKLALDVHIGASQNYLEYFTSAKASEHLESQPSLPAK
jgi:hypothetical protein